MTSNGRHVIQRMFRVSYDLTDVFDTSDRSAVRISQRRRFVAEIARIAAVTPEYPYDPKIDHELRSNDSSALLFYMPKVISDKGELLNAHCFGGLIRFLPKSKVKFSIFRRQLETAGDRVNQFLRAYYGGVVLMEEYPVDSKSPYCFDVRDLR